MADSFPVADIKRTLDTMSYAKLNQFHWHIVDAQSFPLVVPGIPELSAKGAYGADMVYTAADVKDITTYAAVVSTSPPCVYPALSTTCSAASTSSSR